MGTLEVNSDFVKDEPILIGLRKTRDLFSDRIPAEIIHSTDIRVGKVNKFWWTRLTALLELGIANGEIEGSGIMEEVGIFLNYYTGSEFIGSKGKLTSKEDIERANKLINKVLGVPENTGVPYDQVMKAVSQTLEESSNRSIVRCLGMSQTEIAYGFPAYHWTDFSQMVNFRYESPSRNSNGWVITRYTPDLGNQAGLLREEHLQGIIRGEMDVWSYSSDTEKSLLILASRLPNPLSFIDRNLPWFNGPFQTPPYPVWTVAFDGYSRVSLEKHELESGPQWTNL